MSGKREQADAERERETVWAIMERVGICMLVSRLDGHPDSSPESHPASHPDIHPASSPRPRLHARPMAAHVDREAGALYFLTDATSHKEEEIARDPQVCLTFAHPGDNDYVSLSGRAALRNDREKIRELWSIADKPWWDSPDAPTLRLLVVTPEEAHYWDRPGGLVGSVQMLAAGVLGDAEMAEGREGTVGMAEPGRGTRRR